MNMKLYKCSICGQIIMIVKESGVPVVCCGEIMEEIIPGTTDASVEKHVPVLSVSGDSVSVTVGSSLHPMTEAHYIEWIALKTKSGFQVRFLNPGDKPEACFELCGNDTVENAYAFCNLHALWENPDFEEA